MPTSTEFFPLVTPAVVKDLVPEGVALNLPATYDPPFRVFEGQIPRSAVRPSAELSVLEYRYNQRKGFPDNETPTVKKRSTDEQQPGLF